MPRSHDPCSQFSRFCSCSACSCSSTSWGISWWRAGTACACITFSLGFGPKILKFTRGGTEYCISVVPLGGYVKLAGETVEDDAHRRAGRVPVEEQVGPVPGVPGRARHEHRCWRSSCWPGVLSRGADVPLYESSPPVIGTVAAGSPAESGRAPGRRPHRQRRRPRRRRPGTTSIWRSLPKAGPSSCRSSSMRGGQPIDVQVDAGLPSGKYELGDLGVRPVAPAAGRRRSTRARRPSAAGFKRGDVIVGVERRARPGRRRRSSSASATTPSTPLTFSVERDGARPRRHGDARGRRRARR